MNVLYIYETGQRTLLLRGRLLSQWLKAQGIPAVKAPLDRGHRLHRDRLPDVMAAAQESGVSVRIREAA